MLIKLCLSVFFLSWVTFGLRVEDNEFDGSEIDHTDNSPRFLMDMDMNGGDRIYGGQEAAVGQFPHQISIRSIRGHHCGGSILNERFILTAAHCVKGSAPRRIRVVVGAHQNSWNNGTFHIVQRLIVHEDYSISEDKRNDIALVQTATPIQFNDLVRPIRLHPGFIKTAEAIVSGWGSTNDDIKNLKYLNVTTVTNDECRRLIEARFPGSSTSVHDYDTICAFSGRIEHGACFGDSGGPLTVDNQLVGIVSWAVDCGVGVPDGYIRVSTFIDWINSNMQKFQNI